MLDLIKNLLFLNHALVAKTNADAVYDQALALYTARNYEAATPLMIEAAELGSLDAMTILGSMYLLGQAAHFARKYGELQLPDLAQLLSATSVDEKSVGLLRDGTEALIGVLAMVTGGIGDEADVPMQ